MIINRGLNQVATVHDLDLTNLMENPFKQGIQAFFKGKQIPVKLTYLQQGLVQRRSFAIRTGRKHLAGSTTQDLVLQGILVRDRYEGRALVKSTAYSVTVADNPYPIESLSAKEWERGFNASYLRNKRMISRR